MCGSNLTDQQKKIISEEARKAEDAFSDQWVKLASDEEAQLKAKGALITELNAGKDKLNKELGDAAFELAIKQDPRTSASCASSQNRRVSIDIPVAGGTTASRALFVV